MVTLAAPGKKNTFSKSIFNQAAKHLHSVGSYRPEMLSDDTFLAVINETNRVLDNALREGIQDNNPAEEMTRALRDDVFIFSALKTHAQLKEASQLLLNSDGTIKMFSAFKQDVLSVHKAYNINYLEAEYIFATSSAETAAQWQQWQEDGDRYNLQLRTAGDNKVRDSHAVLNLTTLPDDDPFWDEYITPLGWRCRCRTIQVRRGKYPESDSAEAIKKGDLATTRLDKNGINRDEIFRFNPGKDKMIFPPKHPYRTQQGSVKTIVESLKGQNEWASVQSFDNGGLVEVHKSVNRSADDYKDNIECCLHFASKGNKTAVYPKIVKNNSPELYAKTYPELIGTRFDGKSPDFKVGRYFYELEGYTSKNPNGNTIGHMIKRGAEQASRVVIMHVPGTTDRYYRKRVFDVTKQPSSKAVVDELWVKEGKELRIVYKKQ